MTDYALDPTTPDSLFVEFTAALNAWKGHEFLKPETEDQDDPRYWDSHNAHEFITGRIYRLEEVAMGFQYGDPLTPDPSLEFTAAEVELIREFARAYEQYRAVSELWEKYVQDELKPRFPDLKEQTRERFEEAYRRLLKAAREHRPPERPYGFHRLRWDEHDAYRDRRRVSLAPVIHKTAS